MALFSHSVEVYVLAISGSNPIKYGVLIVQQRKLDAAIQIVEPTSAPDQYPPQSYQAGVKCRCHVPFQRPQHRKQSWKRPDTKRKRNPVTLKGQNCQSNIRFAREYVWFDVHTNDYLLHSKTKLTYIWFKTTDVD